MDKEKLNYGVECKDIDFGLLTARNQLIKRVISPLLDMIDPQVKADHVIDSETVYTVSVIVTSTREISVQ